ncbi:MULTISPECIES: DUF4258 domain-containing protein [Spirulina sp. CCY15215]|uniref:DUF4258 domain-containing protein n=1 Tax=Spirulina sp. CCY15215 TaxID=2767591 RepID=UPI0019508DFB|nr:DUF4258 domain-containing protein [Spirulina major]
MINKINQNNIGLKQHNQESENLFNSLLQRAFRIENYPDDKYGASCLILGLTSTNRPLHIQTSYPSRPLIKIITLYQPTPDLWIENFSKRKP